LRMFNREMNMKLSLAPGLGQQAERWWTFYNCRRCRERSGLCGCGCYDPLSFPCFAKHLFHMGIWSKLGGRTETSVDGLDQKNTGLESWQQIAPSHSVFTTHTHIQYLSVYLWWAGDLFLQRAQSGSYFSHLHRGEYREY
jgi:hypothetical protein